jgi:Pectate lyase superfamily protein
MVVPGLAVASVTGGFAAGPPRGSEGARPFFNVIDYGAKADGMTKDTKVVQAAIDAAAEKGGTVYFPGGKYLSGTLRLKSFVTLFLDAGAILLGSPDDSDYDPYEKLSYNSCSDRETTYFNSALIRAEDAHNFAIAGRGIIDGNRTKRGGPKPIALKRCQQVSIRDITMQNAPNYNISMLGCDYVDIEGVTIFNGYADGIDPDCSRYVRISNCYIETFDDAIVPKASPSLGEIRPTEHLTVTNCVLTTASSALKFGTESSGDFKNIAFSNCTIFARPEKWGRGPLGGVALESVDGSNIDGVVVSNIVMEDVLAPIFIRLGNRGRCQSTPTPGSLQNVSIANVVATGSTVTSSITGIPGHYVRNVTLQNIRISAAGGAAAMETLEVPEVISKYPEEDMFGTLPAYGFYCRHVHGLCLEGLNLQLEKADARPALIADDIGELDLLSFRADPCSSDQPIVLLKNVETALVQGARAARGTKNFMLVSGANTEKVHLMGNDFSEAKTPLITDNDVNKEMLRETGNLDPKS